MGKFLVKRFIRGLLTIFCSVTITFFLLRLMPADPVSMMIDPQMTQETIDAITQQYGLDKPLIVQYGAYLFQLLQGNLGTSFRMRVPVSEMLLQKLPWTLILLTLSISMALLIGIPVGLKAAKHRNGAFDKFVNVFTMMCVSIFVPFLAFGLLFIFSYTLKILPTGGAYNPPPAQGLAYAADVLRHAILPACALTISNCASIILYTRNSMIEVSKEDYIRTARAKGWDDRYITRKHAMRNAMIPTITSTSLLVTRMVGGSIMTETIFSWPGIGRMIFDSVSTLDYPVLQGTFLVLSITAVVINIITDIVLAWVDPRIKLGGKKA